MKYIVTSYSPFHGTIRVGTINADSPEQAILVAAQYDGWDIGTTQDRDVVAFLRSIEDQYTATLLTDLGSYTESK